MRNSTVDANRRFLFVLVVVVAWIFTAANRLAYGQEQKQLASEESADQAPTLHEFNFTAEAFPGRPDGRPKELWGYNRQFPGPEIRVREGLGYRSHAGSQRACR